MQWDAHATNQDLTTFTDDLCGTSSTTYSAEAKVRAANQRHREMLSVVHAAYGGWIFDDQDHTDLPIVTTTLTSGTARYAIDAEAEVIRGVEVLNAASSGDWVVVEPITLEQLRERTAHDEFLTTNGIPRYYTLMGRVLEFYPAPNYTVSAGIKIFFDRDVVDFSSTGDDTKTPSCASQFHEILAYGMALTYMQRKKMAAVEQIRFEWLNGLSRLKKFYSERWAEMFPPRITVNDSIRRYE